MAKLYLDDIRQEFYSLGWELLSTTYKNLKTPLDARCPVGHNIAVTYEKWRKKHECPICAAKENKSNVPDAIPEKVAGARRVLALDDATSITGWSLFDGNKLIGYGKINMTKANPIARMAGLKQWLINAIKLWDPDLIGLEDIQLQKYRDNHGEEKSQVKMFKTLAQLQGVLLTTLFELKKESAVIYCNTWRSALQFSSKTRTDQKREAQLKVKNWYGVAVSSDEADSICIGRYLVEKYMRNNYLIEWGME